MYLEFMMNESTLRNMLLFELRALQHFLYNMLNSINAAKKINS